MSRRPSTISLNTHIPSNQQVPQTPTRFVGSPKRSGSNGRLPRVDTMSAKLSVHVQGQGAEFDLEEMFTKYTISEVKAVQRQLRADADAKQEELRLMVGERYRDLLQASTSIISIARSSKRVMEALQETKESILAEEPLPIPKRKHLSGKDNPHLEALQLLSAHVKLLLDAPERLWRLIERKEYFSAAWLFLLARVVHRALVSDDEQDESSWSSRGIDVLEDFPLVQRQWDAVSQFRLQIIHKSTLSLRDYTSRAQDVCATLLTLHLLDSRPLTDTLSVLLSQRSKAVQTKLSASFCQPSLEIAHSSSSPIVENGHLPEATDLERRSHNFLRPAAGREVRQACQAALESICATITTCRNIFLHETPSSSSMIGRVLQRLQSDGPPSPSLGDPPSSELEMTTQTLLATLPSSTHFLLLPPTLRNYKPYVDATSSSSTIPQEHFSKALEEWFHKMSRNLRTAIERWFLELRSVKEIWSVRLSIRRWIHSMSELAECEKSHLWIVLDDVCRDRITEIWKLLLSLAETAYRDRMESATRGESDVSFEASAPQFLFQPVTSPTLTSTMGLHPVLADSSLQKYRSTLRRQLNGRTPALYEMLSALEECANTIQSDVSEVLKGSGDSTRILVEQLVDIYQPNADALCMNILGVLSSAVDAQLSSPQNTDSLVFLARVADGLAQSSFASNIRCTADVADDFRTRTRAVHEQILEQWLGITISQVVSDYRDGFCPPPQAFSIDFPCSGPSASLVNALLSLTTSIQKLGISLNKPEREPITGRALRQFITALQDGDRITTRSLVVARQELWDLLFLQRMAMEWEDARWSDCVNVLNRRTAQMRAELPPDDSTPIAADSESCSDALARTQVLLATLLPRLPPTSAFSSAQAAQGVDKLATLLFRGTPSSDPPVRAALEVAQPSARFGLLLVTNPRGS